MDKQLSFLKAFNPLFSVQNKPALKKTQPKETFKVTPIHIFVDGASRNNPGPAGAGVYITLNDKPEIEKGFYLGEKTNNQAEYLALLLSIFLVNDLIVNKKIKNPHLIITSDSELLIRQMYGSYKIKNPVLSDLRKIIDKLLVGKRYTFHHVLREKNKIADKLANKGIDSKTDLPKSFVELLESNQISL